MKIAGVYKIRNKVNGKYYIGSSNNVNKRMFYEHRRMLRNGIHFNQHLQSAWDKYGEDNFEFLIVRPAGGVVSDTFLLELEQAYLDMMRKTPSIGYNTTYIAGKVEFTPEIRRKMSLKQKERLKKYGHPFLGKHHDQETLERMSKSHIGKKLSSAARKKISGDRSVAHRQEVKQKKRLWWEQLRQNPEAYAEFCKQRAIKSARKRYGDNLYAKNYEVIHQ